MHVIQLAEAQWLVLDRQVRPQFLMVKGPMVDRATGETHIVFRIEWWSIVKSERRVLAVLPHELVARDWCRAEIERAEHQRESVYESVARRGF
ncbi:hypothetical protein [Microbacterium sp.]|uniref:hypothetical protein n=1 Tax=Microbacterium sp. TaxID=51671 RepID=UPI0028120EE7|nr:hypothetical protein [Microbacterium sp.]